MSRLAWVQLALVVILGTTGQLALKYALRQDGRGRTGVRLLVSFPMLIWLLCYAVTAVLWLITLRSIPLSQAFPILGLQFALIPLAASRLLRERITPTQWLGVIVIVVGVALVGQS
jgi:undecaprenyl phosphate-alpha-L-ara4N flippase subunit ArnE